MVDQGGAAILEHVDVELSFSELVETVWRQLADELVDAVPAGIGSEERRSLLHRICSDVLLRTLQALEQPTSLPLMTTAPRDELRTVRTDHLVAAEALFEVAVGPLTAWSAQRHPAAEVARMLHRSIWNRFLPDKREVARAAWALRPLTNREVEVLTLVAAALTNQQIAAQLNLAPGTVKRHIANISDKLSAVSRLDAVRRGHILGIL